MSRENWGSRFGYIMAATGFSVGLGNIWRFPYLAGSNGGGAFIFVYILICFFICIPLLTMEISLGRKAQLNPIEGMRSITNRGSVWVSFGWLGIITAFIILTYYIQIMGWILIYLFKTLFGSFSLINNNNVTFNDITSNTVLVIGATFICVIIVGVISAKGLEKGIEKACKFMMPALLIMLIILAIRSLTLPNSLEGLKWYLTVDFSMINGQVLLAALGQGFFSIGIACGGAFVYGSYLNRNSNIPEDATLIVGLDTLIAFLAGLVIFPAIFAMGLEPNSGPSLLFVTMANLFSNLPAGIFFGVIFYLLIFFAAITSAIGYLEPIVMTCTELFNFKRITAVLLSLTLIFLAGLPMIKAHGSWSEILIGGKNFFEFADYLSGNILMPLGALILAFYTLLVWKFEKYKDETNIGTNKYKINNWWSFFIKYLLPISIILIFVTGII